MRTKHPNLKAKITFHEQWVCNKTASITLHLTWNSIDIDYIPFEDSYRILILRFIKRLRNGFLIKSFVHVVNTRNP